MTPDRQNEMVPTPAADSIQRSLRLLMVATVVLTLALGGVAFKTYHDSSEARGSLCTLRGDLERRVEQSRRYLRENPNGAPGIPARLIRDGIRNQERTIRSLGNLSC